MWAALALLLCFCGAAQAAPMQSNDETAIVPSNAKDAVMNETTINLWHRHRPHGHRPPDAQAV